MVESVDSAIEIGRCGSEQEKVSTRQPRQSLITRAIKQVSSLFQLLLKLGYDDHRRAIHSLKVGLALSLVCLLTILEPVYNVIGRNTIWALMTVIVVFEYTAVQKHGRNKHRSSYGNNRRSMQKQNTDASTVLVTASQLHRSGGSGQGSPLQGTGKVWCKGGRTV
ncbi:hypothetical protein O6H91_10G080000 [Diphasiastrum complanatum]|uniref:Uncharacterized protein n=1 Tax=Diphasiastrum complanatum TaxID=34168 RepID=A0ACC2CIJ5_DIPCM|nr:hypothetical protein O6H91_10G080000 [Diphasiastrum complanatum]